MKQGVPASHPGTCPDAGGGLEAEIQWRPARSVGTWVGRSRKRRGAWRRPRRELLGVLLVQALAAACHLNTLPPPGLAEQQNLSVVGSELRVRVRALVGPYVGALEAAADEAAVRCPDPIVRQNALAWKIQAVPLAQDALLQADPLVALVDGWAYAVQLRNLLGGEAGADALGACTAAAASSMRRLAEAARAIAVEVAGRDVTRADRLVERWAYEHPLRALLAPRATVAAALATATTRKELGALAAVGTIVETLDDLTTRIAAYRETILKEARWTGELAVAQAGASDLAARAAEDAARLALAADRMGALVERIPALLEREREAAVAAVRGERVAVLADLDRQRTETLRAMRSETETVFGRMDGLSRGAIDEASARAERIVDRAFLRTAELVLGLAAIAVIVALLAARMLGIPIPRVRRT